MYQYDAKSLQDATLPSVHQEPATFASDIIYATAGKSLKAISSPLPLLTNRVFTSMPSSHHSPISLGGIPLGQWISLHLVIAHAVMLPTDHRELRQVNDTSFTNFNDIEVHCSNDRNWVDSRTFFDPKECFGSIYFMIHEEHAESYHEDTPVMFVSHMIDLAHAHEAVQTTPRKYSPCTWSDECTLLLNAEIRLQISKSS